MPVQHQSVWVAEGKSSSLHHSRKWALSSCSGPVKSLEPFIPTQAGHSHYGLPSNAEIRLRGLRSVTRSRMPTSGSTVPCLRMSVICERESRPVKPHDLLLTWGWVFREPNVSIYAKDLCLTSIITTVLWTAEPRQNRTLTTSLMGSSGMVSSIVIKVSVMFSTKLCQSFSACLKSGSCTRTTSACSNTRGQ